MSICIYILTYKNIFKHKNIWTSIKLGKMVKDIYQLVHCSFHFKR